MNNAIPGKKGYQTVPVEERFWEKISVRGPSECWPWHGTNVRGYGTFWLNGRTRRATQVSWSLWHKTPFPEGLHACHTCDNPPCCNPRHIWPGTARDYLLDASRIGRLHGPTDSVESIKNRAKTHCKFGHPYTVDNTYINRVGWRDCRLCRKRRQVERTKDYQARAALTKEPS